MGKVIAKSRKELQVLITDKVYKIEPGSTQDIKIGDKIQVFFGKNLPQEISEEMLKKISGKLIDVFSLSLPYKTTKELEDLINQMPQNERLQFAKISNNIVQMIESIMKEEFSFEVVKDAKSKKNSFDLFDPNLPYNRRLVELSIKAKEMGKAWEQIPDELKKEIIKKYVLFDLQKQKAQIHNTSTDINKTELSPESEGGLERKARFLSGKDQQNVFEKESIIINNKADLKTIGNDQENQMKNNQSPENSMRSKLEVDKTLEQRSQNLSWFTQKTSPTNENNKKNIQSPETYPHDHKKVLNTENTVKSTTINTNKDNIHIDSSTDTDKRHLKPSEVEVIPDKEKNLNQPSKKAELNTNIQEKSMTNKNQTKTQKNHGISFSKEDIKILTAILEKSISKPQSMEKNLESIDNLAKIGNLNTKVLESYENKEKQSNLSQETKYILQIIQKLSSLNDTSKKAAVTHFLKEQGNIIDFSNTENFTKLTHSPLMNVEINHMISAFKGFGISQKEASDTTHDIVNIAARAINEENISVQLYSTALKKYLTIKLPQLIMNNDIEQNNEKSLISKIESFSKKAFMIVKAYAERLINQKELETIQSKTKNVEKKQIESQLGESKKSRGLQNNPKTEMKINKNLTTNDGEKLMNTRASTNKALEGNAQSKQIGLTAENKETPNNPISDKRQAVSEQLNHSSLNEKIHPHEDNKMQLNPKSTENNQKIDYSSEKLIKFLNVSSEKPDFSNPYSSLITLNEQPFVIDFHHQKMDKGGYEKNEMYRVFIETNTQLFGTVFVDTVVSNKKIDIYIYAEDQYAKAFTNHSSTLIKRIKETDYELRGLFIREKLEQNGILKLKVKQYTNHKKEGSFFSLA